MSETGDLPPDPQNDEQAAATAGPTETQDAATALLQGRAERKAAQDAEKDRLAGEQAKADADTLAGKRNAKTVALSLGWNAGRIKRALAALAMANAPDPPKPADPTAPVWSAEDAGPPRDVGEGITADLTDVYNAEKLLELHGTDLRWVGTWGKGLAWDGRRWTQDNEGHWPRAAVKTSRVIVAEAIAAVARDVAIGGDARVQRKQLAEAITSQRSARITAMQQVARSHVNIILHHDRLDADPDLLCVQNGTIDLRTGRLRDSRREDLGTRVCPVAYDPEAKCPTWDAFLLRSMGGDQGLVDYLHRLIGYSMTGGVGEHVLIFLYGKGANGKSTFLSTIHALLGDYATPAPRGLLFQSRGERHPTELATLYGRRFVTCSEIEDGQVFDEALTKDLTGGDPIECRRMREDFWTYCPTHKLWIAGNHKPFVKGDDEGIWRRMRLIPWTIMIPEAERDTSLPEKLRAELPGILARAVQGCIDWRKNGLESPEAVLAATKAYRAESDAVGEFLRVYCVFEPHAKIARKALRESYESWCKDAGSEPLGARRFASRLRDRGVSDTGVATPSGPRDGWAGVRLASDAERQAALTWGNSGPVVHTNGAAAPPPPAPVDAPFEEPENLADWAARQP